MREKRFSNALLIHAETLRREMGGVKDGRSKVEEEYTTGRNS